MRPPVALTIAGSDSGGGAGIQADLKTFSALGVHGTSAITAITAQNTVTVSDVEEVSAAVVRAQIDRVVEDLAPAAAKTGMLATAEIIVAVVGAVSHHRLRPLVVDPVMVAKGGARLLRGDAVAALRGSLLPLATVITPNLPEAEVLLDLQPGALSASEDRRRAVAELKALGPQAVVLKGGHAEDDSDSVDLFYDGAALRELRGRRVATANTHGSGCVFSAAICANLALGHDLPTAVERAKEFIQGAIENALEIGHGHGPVNPLH
jgi:hydroxymethylpyrimidine kinase/phosphomethylpyrimidine kinase